MQVYRDLRILTARPTPQEEAQAPHRLYGHVDGAVNFSVGHYLRDAAAVLAEARAARRLPIFVGGTGLYFKALVEGLSDIPAVPEAVRERVRAAAEGRDSAALHAELAGRDPATALRLRPSDRLRILRALEVVEATGQSLLAFQGRRRPGLLGEAASVRLFLAPERDALRRRIDARFVAMIDGGAIEEVRALEAPPARSDAAGDARPWRARAPRPSARRDHPRRRRSPAARATRGATPSASSPGSATRCRAGPPSRRRRRRRRSTT